MLYEVITNRLYALGFHLVGRNLQCVGECFQVGIEHQGPVVHYAAGAHILSVAGELRITSYNVCYTKLLRYVFSCPGWYSDYSYIFSVFT